MIQHTVEKITPKLAEAYLELNTFNRQARLAHVARLANDMASGRWVMNGAPIVFNGDGTLLDGQHRLLAIVRAGVPVDMLVVRGVSKTAMATIDSNVSRTAADVLSIDGLKNTNRTAAAVRILLSLKDGQYNSTKKRSNSEIYAFLQQHPMLPDAVTEVYDAAKLLRSAAVIPWFYLATHFTKQGILHETRTARQALDTIVSGIPAYDGDPMHVFRERVIRSDVSLQAVSDRLSFLWTLIASWNAFVHGEKSKICKIRRGPVGMIGVNFQDL